MNTILFVTIAFLFFLLLISFFITVVIWGTTPIGKDGCGSKCDFTNDCPDGLVCQNGECVIGYYGNCDGNEDYCLRGSKCVLGVCLPTEDNII